MRRVARALLAEMEHCVLDIARDYAAFVAQMASAEHHGDAKLFAAHHAAARAALVHLEHLLKLQASASGKGDSADLVEAQSLLIEARQAIALLPAPQHFEEENDADGGATL
jgi:hypothetical protein